MYETLNVSAEILNTAFLNKIDSGMVKEAEEAGSAYIRQRLYEDGFLRRLFTPKTVTADELDPLLDSDTPSIIVEKEPTATKATFVPFKGTGDRTYFDGRRFRIPFGKVESERINKSKFELMTIRMDIMAWLKENQSKIIQEQEDGLFMSTIADIISGNAANQSTSVDVGTTLTFKDAFVAGLKGLTALKQPVGKVLMHKNTYLSSLALKVEDIGFKMQDARMADGVEGEDKFMGFPVVTTIKSDLVAEDVLYFFAPQEYFCKFYLLQDATLFIKTEADMYSFHTYEAPGFGIGNTYGVYKVTLT
jgi:hypothetical protein